PANRAVAVLKPLALRQRVADFNKSIWHKTYEPRHVAAHGAGLPMFRHSVGRADDGKGIGTAGPVERRRLPELRARARLGLREQISNRALHRLVVLGEWAIRKVRTVELSNARCQHDKRIHLTRRHGAVGDVAFPSLGLGVPADDPFTRVERLALSVNTGAVIKDAASPQPHPGPLRIKPNAVRGIGRITAGGQVALLSVTAAVDPVAAS